MGRENSFQSTVLEYLNKIPGCMAENVSGDSSQSGRPDITGCYKGRAFKFELKQPDNKYEASLKQNIELRRWRNAGCVVGVIYSMKALKLLFEVDWDWGKPKTARIQEANGCISWYEVPKMTGSYLCSMEVL